MRNPIHCYRSWAAARRAAADAREQYSQLDRQAAVHFRDLARTAHHGARWRLLRLLAEQHLAMALQQQRGWGTRTEDGRDVAESTRLAGLALWMVADAEGTLAWPGQGRQHSLLPEERAGVLMIETVALPILDAAIAAGRIDRAVLDELYAAVRPVVGGQAAEAVWCVPVPGNRSDYKLTG